MKARPDYSCAGCGIDVDKAGEYSWMVKRVLWDQSLATARRRRGVSRHQVSTRDLVCIGCFENRIHRLVTGEDFEWRVPLNVVPGYRSERLLARMGHHFLAAHIKHQEREQRAERSRERLRRGMAGGAG